MEKLNEYGMLGHSCGIVGTGGNKPKIERNMAGMECFGGELVEKASHEWILKSYRNSYQSL